MTMRPRCNPLSVCLDSRRGDSCHPSYNLGQTARKYTVLAVSTRMVKSNIEQILMIPVPRWAPVDKDSALASVPSGGLRPQGNQSYTMASITSGWKERNHAVSSSLEKMDLRRLGFCPVYKLHWSQ